MTRLDYRDLDRCVRRLPPALVKTIQERESLMVAGGFIRTVITNERPSDIDVFATDDKGAKTAAGNYRQRCGPADRQPKQVDTDNAITVLTRPPVQFIHRWTFDGPDKLIQSFDFSIARAVIWWSGARWESMIDDRFYVDLAARRLVFMAPSSNTSGGTLLRLQKFIARGYRASAANIAAIAAQLARDAMREKTIVGAGIEDEVARQMIRLVREVDPSSADWDEETDPAREPVPPPPVDDGENF